MRVKPYSGSLDYDNRIDLFIFSSPEAAPPASKSSKWGRVFYFNREEERSLQYLLDLVHAEAVEEAVLVVEDPSWDEIARGLGERYGWKIVQGSQALDEELLEKVTRLYGRASIIIVSYNGLDLIKQCVGSILDRTIYPDYRIIIVDNNSNEEVRAYLSELNEREEKVDVVLNDTNEGFPAANNRGLALAAGSGFYILLNNDTVVPRGWLCRLVRKTLVPDIGIVGPVTNWTGNEARVDVTYSELKDMEAFARQLTRANEGKVFDIPMLAMYCVAMRNEVYEKVGALDERFGMGMFEDQDYARRVRDAGFRVVCAEDVFVHHYGMASFSKLDSAFYQELFEKNKKLYEEKWQEPWIPHEARSK